MSRVKSVTTEESKLNKEIEALEARVRSAEVETVRDRYRRKEISIEEAASVLYLKNTYSRRTLSRSC